MNPTNPKLKMPEGFPRLFVGDGKTPFKGPAMCKIKPVRDADEWQLADGDLYGKFSIKHVYALPALPRKVSVTAAAREYSGKRDLQLAFMAGARWAMEREARQ